MSAESAWDRGPGDQEPMRGDATGAGRCPAYPELLAVLALEPWGSKIFSSTTQACGDGCSLGEGKKGAAQLLGLHVKRVGSFLQVFQCQRSPELGKLWYLGRILKAQPALSVCGTLSGPCRPPSCASAAGLVF